MKKVRPNWSKLLMFWVVSYLFVSLMPIVLGCFVYNKALRTITEEVESTSQLSLRQYQSVMDSNIEEIQHMSATLSLSAPLKNLASLKSPSGSDATWNVYQLQRDISSFLLTNNNIKEIYIYLKQCDFIVSSGYKYNADTLSAVCPPLLGLTRDEILEMSSRKDVQPIRFTGQNTFLYVTPLYIDSFSRPSGLIIVKCNNSQFDQLISNLEQAVQGKVCLLSTLGEAYWGGEMQSLPVDYEALQREKTIFSVDTEAERVVCTHMPSSQFKLQYLSLIPESVFLSKVRYIRYVIYFYVALCILLGTVLTLYFVHRSYKPVRKLSQLLGKASVSGNGGVNELTVMEESLVQLLDEKRRIESRLEQQEYAIRNNLIGRILKGYVGDVEQAQRSLAEHGVVLAGNTCLVTAISLDRLNGKTLQELDEAETESIVYLLSQRVSEHLIRQKYCVATAEVDGLIAFIVTTQLAPQPQDDFYDDCANLMQQTVHFIHEKFDASLSAFVSDVHIGLQGAPEAFSEVLQAVEYRTLTGEQCPLVTYRSLNSFGQSAQSFSVGVERQRQLSNAVVAQDYAGARRMIDGMLEEYAQTTPSLQLLRYRAVSIFNTMLESVSRAGDPENAERLNVQPILQALLGAHTLPEMKTKLSDFLALLEESQLSHDQQRTPDWLEAVDEYVHQHYQDPELSVSGIAEALQISMSYLSRSYKKYRGVGLLDDIHQYRIQKAKELMNTVSVQDIARRVGYYDGKALVRVFKKYEGVTPSKFKDIGAC